MNNLPPKLRKELVADPFYKTCAREGLFDHECGGRITWEHAMYFAGKQIQKKWAIIPLCAKAHSVDNFQDGGDLDKHLNEWIALNRATDEDLLPVCKTIDYFHYRHTLNIKYGKAYIEPILEESLAY